MGFTGRQASPTGATTDRRAAGYLAEGDIGLAPWGISPTRRAVGGRYNAPKGSGPHGELLAEDSGATEAWGFVKTISGNRDMGFTGRQASPTGATTDRRAAGYLAEGDIGLAPWGISPTRRAVGGATTLPRGAAPTANSSPRIPALRRPGNSSRQSPGAAT